MTVKIEGRMPPFLQHKQASIMSASAPFRWYKKAAFDAPQLNSPQPCSHGAGCNYTVKDKETGEEVAGCCAFVHPGEEGNGRRLFEARTSKNEAGETITQKACVRLTGKAGFYERRRLRLSWPAWCEQKGLPYTPNPDEKAKPDTLVIPTDRKEAIEVLMGKLSEMGVDMRPVETIRE